MDISRRTALMLPAAASTVTLGGVASARASNPALAVAVYPITATKTFVVMTGATDPVTVRNTSGATVGSIAPTSLSTVLRVNAATGTRLTVSAGSFRASVLVGTPAGSIARLVNKRTPLGTYVPSGLILAERGFRLTPAAATAYGRMRADAARAGHQLRISEAYRSFETQRAQYSGYVAKFHSAAVADGWSARPGYSEHQLGLTIDLMSADDVNTQKVAFGSMPVGRWIAASAWRYGFILRYPSQAAKTITGYNYEPWHVRYVGPALAADMHRAAWQTYDRYTGSPDAPAY